jgi:hypothetical protein
VFSIVPRRRVSGTRDGTCSGRAGGRLGASAQGLVAFSIRLHEIVYHVDKDLQALVHVSLRFSKLANTGSVSSPKSLRRRSVSSACAVSDMHTSISLEMCCRFSSASLAVSACCASMARRSAQNWILDSPFDALQTDKKSPGLEEH